MHWSILVFLVMGAMADTQTQLGEPGDSALGSAGLVPGSEQVIPTEPTYLHCGINEHLESNSNKCQITCDNMRYEAIMGACAPTDDCYCDKGYVRNEEGNCIKREDCPRPRCPKGEVWNECGSSCPPSCANRANPPLACTLQCVAGCFCADGTVRAPDGSCVEPNKCPPPRCPKGEVWNECGSSCPPSCANRANPPLACTQQCVTGCFCADGTVRAPDGSCVEPNKCPPPRCPKGEVWNECGSSCPPSCANRNNTCLVCTQQCVPGCFCAGDTIRAPNGSCVKPINCPPRTCSGPNEVFDKCPPTCPRTEKCENIWARKPCTPIDCCEPKCRCKPGYYRNDENVCVSTKECTNQCGPNEVFTECYNDCQKTCKNRFQRNPKVCPLVCNQTGCICKENYLRHDNGTCVPEYQCSPPECGEGEVYSDCNWSCSELCEDRGNTCLACVAACIPGCYCAKNTFRAPDGSCVKPKNCPPRICGRNEVFDKCPPTCPKTDGCKNIWSKEPCTPIDCCKPSCRCKSGYYRNERNACVTAAECSGGSPCGCG